MELYNLEEMMYQVSGLFLTPVLLIIAVLFVYSFYALGMFAAQYMQRRANQTKYLAAIKTLKGGGSSTPLAGYQVFSRYVSNGLSTQSDLELYAIKRLENVRIVTRIAPMLGLVATMVPMGPALKALADGNIQGISENLVIAFAAVIFGLVTASVTFWIAAVCKRWLATELNDLSPVLISNQDTGP